MSSRKKARREQNKPENEAPIIPVWADDTGKDSEEEQLEQMLFGGASFKQNLKSHKPEKDSTGLEDVPDSDLFFFDAGTSVEKHTHEEDSSDESSHSESESESNDHSQSPNLSTSPQVSRSKGGVWADPDDQSLRISMASDKRLRKLRTDASEDVITGGEYEKRLRQQFETINPVPQWANKARRKRRRDEMEEDEVPGAFDHLVNSTSGVSTSSRLLTKGTIDIERLRDANQASQTEGDVKAIMFHPSPTVSVMLSAGGDRRLKLFNIDGHANPLLQTVHIPSLPIASAVFHPSGSHILLTGSRPFFYNYDLQSGVCTKSPRGLWGSFASNVDNVDHSLEKNAFSPTGDVLAVAGRRGHIYLVDWTAGNAQVAASLKMNTGVQSLWWNRSSDSDSRELYALGENSEVYVWDIRSRTCLRKWKDEGGYGATQIAGSDYGDHLAIGSKSGIVNVYGSPNSATNPKHLKSFGNLTTKISSLHFNHNSELMVMSSSVKKDQLRLIHLPSLTVYSNWPTSSTPLGKVTATSFSQGSEYLAIGNSRGRILLYGLRYFWNVQG